MSHREENLFNAVFLFTDTVPLDKHLIEQLLQDFIASMSCWRSETHEFYG
jgi:hypothetical protein